MSQANVRYQPLLIELATGDIAQFCIPETYGMGQYQPTQILVGEPETDPQIVISKLPDQLNQYSKSESGYGRSKRIALITDDPGWGGVATHAFSLAKQLIQAGFTVALAMSSTEDLRLEDLSEHPNLFIYEIPYNTVTHFSSTLTDSSPVLTLIQDFEPDLIVFEDSCPVSMLAAREAAALAEVPYICIEHLVEPYLQDKFAAECERLKLIYGRAEDVIAVSGYSLACLEKYFHLEHKGRVIYNGVDSRYFIPLPKSVLIPLCVNQGILPLTEMKTIVCVGRLSPEKQVGKIVRAFKKLIKQQMPENSFQLLIVGDGPERQALENLVFALKLDSDVTFIGHQSDVLPYLNIADLFVHLGQYEGLPMAILEAMAAGVPVIASNVGGIPEIFAGDELFVVPSDIDEAELAAHICNFFTQDPALISERCLTQKNYLVERFLEADMTSSLIGVIEGSLKQKSYYDYVSPNLTPIDLRPLFPSLDSGVVRSNWDYLRSHIPHQMYFHRDYPMVGYFNLDEATILYNIALQFPRKNMLEIGCWFGWCSLHLLQVPESQLTIVDVLLGESLRNQSPWKAYLVNLLYDTNLISRTQLIPTKSEQFFEQYEGDPFDLILIDGDHEGEAPLADAIAASKVVSDRCAIIFHDLVSPDVYKGFLYLVEQGWKFRIYTTQQMIGVVFRGNVDLPLHCPDPAVDWPTPDFLKSLSGQIMQGKASELDHSNTEFDLLYKQVKDITLLPKDRLRQLFENAKAVCLAGIPGDFIDCGVYQGGSTAVLIYVVNHYSKQYRLVHGVDTFTGMVAPGSQDGQIAGTSAAPSERAEGDLAVNEQKVVDNILAALGGDDQPFELVKININTDYKAFLSEYIDEIAFLHSDTDFYKSTLKTLMSSAFYLSAGAVVQVDDYHHWRGTKKAVDEFVVAYPQVKLKEITQVGGAYFEWKDPKLQTPVVLIAYNRPELTQVVVNAIAAANPGIVYAILDAPGAQEDHQLCKDVKEIIEQGFRDCPIAWIEADEHMGGAHRVISGLQQVFELTDRAIILEDDCVPDPTFFQYCQQMLNHFEGDQRIWHISGNNFQLNPEEESLHLSKFPHCWGWATWKSRWQKARMTEVNGSYLSHPDRLRAMIQRNFEPKFQGVPSFSHHFVDFWTAKFKHLVAGNLNWDYLWQLKIWENNGFCVLSSTHLVENIGIHSGQHIPSSMVFKLLFAGKSSSECRFPDLPVWKNLDGVYQASIEKEVFVQQSVFNQNYDSLLFQNELRKHVVEGVGAINEFANFATLTVDDIEVYGTVLSGLVSLLQTLQAECKGISGFTAQVLAQLNFIPIYFLDKAEFTMRRRADLFQSLMKAWGMDLEWEMEPKQPDTPISIGVLVETMASQTEGYANLPWLNIPNENTEVTLLSVYDNPSQVMDIAKNYVNQTVILSDICPLASEDAEGMKTFLQQAVRAIRELNFDVIYFGSNLTAVTNISSLLAQFRLARYQVISHNCPISPQFSTIDGYITSSYFVGDTSQQRQFSEHYSEKLIVHNSPAQVFHMLPVDETHQCTTVCELFGKDQFVMICGANFYKLNNIMLRTYLEIINNHEQACLFLYPFNPNWSNKYPVQRFMEHLHEQAGEVGADLLERVKVLQSPLGSRSELLAHLQGAHLYLDSFPYGGMTSLLDPLQLNIPIVTAANELPVSNMGASMLEVLGMHMQVVGSKSEYMELVSSLIESYFSDQQLWLRTKAAFADNPVSKFTDHSSRLVFSTRIGELLSDIVNPLVEH